MMEIIFDYCYQERQQHHTVKKERGGGETMVKLRVGFKGSSQDKGLELQQ